MNAREKVELCDRCERAPGVVVEIQTTPIAGERVRVRCEPCAMRSARAELARRSR